MGAATTEQQAFEAWTITRAHEIMMREGLQLALSAQNLDRKKVKADSYRLHQAITDCLMEVRNGAFLAGRPLSSAATAATHQPFENT